MSNNAENDNWKLQDTPEPRKIRKAISFIGAENGLPLAIFNSTASLVRVTLEKRKLTNAQLSAAREARQLKLRIDAVEEKRLQRLEEKHFTGFSDYPLRRSISIMKNSLSNALEERPTRQIKNVVDELKALNGSTLTYNNVRKVLIKYLGPHLPKNVIQKVFAKFQDKSAKRFIGGLLKKLQNHEDINDMIFARVFPDELSDDSHKLTADDIDEHDSADLENKGMHVDSWDRVQNDDEDFGEQAITYDAANDNAFADNDEIEDGLYNGPGNSIIV